MRKPKLPWKSAPIQRDLRSLTVTEFCLKHNVSIATVCVYRRRAGLTRVRRDRRRPPKTLAKDIERYSVEALARKYGVGSTVVSRWLVDLGVDTQAARVRRLYGGDARRRARDHAVRLRQQGKSIYAIGAQLKMSVSKANQLLHEAGMQTSRGPRVTRMGAMAVLRAAGFTLEQIGQAFSLTRERARQILARVAKVAP